MRVWGRQVNNDLSYTWVEVETDADGYNDEVMLTAFCQVLQLQPGESPFYGQYGVPAIQSVHNQTFPTANVYYMQQLYSPNFVALSVTPMPAKGANGEAYPMYNVVAVANTGAILTAQVAI